MLHINETDICHLCRFSIMYGGHWAQVQSSSFDLGCLGEIFCSENKHKTVIFVLVYKEMNWLIKQGCTECKDHDHGLTIIWRITFCNRYVRITLYDCWTTQFENKLHSVQLTLGCGSLSNREHLALCRPRLGHIYFTHTGWENPPVCVSNQENMIVEHILIHCASY